MPIRCTCPSCDAAYTVDNRFAGRTTKCKVCGGSVAIPCGIEPPPFDWSQVTEKAPEAPSPGPSAVATQRPRDRMQEYDDERPGRRPSRRRPGFRCPYCGSTRRPRRITRVSPAGWLVGAILLVTTCVFCWVGALITETSVVCADCRIKLGGTQ